MTEISLDEIYTPTEFARRYPELVDGPGRPKMTYLMRNRDHNGLVKSGAVIEPTERRPMIVAPRFLEWLLNRRAA